MTRKVLIVTHSGRPEALSALDVATQELSQAGFTVARHIDALSPDFGDAQATAHLREGVTDCELVMVLGGDGSILRAAELTFGTAVPILGVNLGHMGFLAEAERENLHDVVQRIARREYEVEERTVAAVTVTPPGGVDPITAWALNEATVEKAGRLRLIEVGIGVDDRPLSSIGCDGVIIATSTGSTAHAFSAGGPIMWPDLDALLLIPLAAHALFSRPLVIGPRSAFQVTVLGRSPLPAVLTCDGRRTTDLPPGSRVDVRVGDKPIRFARLHTAPFADRLVSKFSLPIKGWREIAEDAAANRESSR